MRRPLAATVGCAAALSLIAACGGGDSDHTTQNPATGGAGSRGTDGGTALKPLTDPQVALLLLDANAEEVGDGGLGLARATNGQVIAFAQRMINDHSMAIVDARMMLANAKITPQQSTVGQQRSISSVSAQQELRLQPLSQFDAALLCHELEAHSEVIELIDSAQSAMQGPLGPLLQANRATSQAHLTLAQQILTTLAAAGGQTIADGEASQFCAQFRTSGGPTPPASP